MNILLLNPPFLPKFSRAQRSPAVTKSGTLYYPIWLAYAAGVLDQAGFDVQLIDAPAANLSLEHIGNELRSHTQDIIVLDTSTPSIQNDLRVAKHIKSVSPDTLIILVGPHVSALPDETLALEPAVDAIIRGEYEKTLLELAKSFAKNDQNDRNDLMQSICGLSYRSPQGIVHNPGREYIQDLDSLPWVSRMYKRFLNPGDYFNPNAFHPMVTLISSRGCAFRCSFCLYPQTMTGRRFRFRSIPDVVDEMEYALDAFPHVRSVFFEDDTLTANKERCQYLAQEIMDRKLKINWTANSRVELDYQTMRMLRASGCRMLCVGFESGDEQVLAAMRKRVTKEKMFTFVRDARKAGILIHGCFIFGFPGEDKAAVQRTIDLSLQLSLDTAQFYPVMVYPGTEAYEEYKAKGLLSAASYSDWLTPAGLHNCVVHNEYFSSKELVRICDEARKRFYLRPRYVGYRIKKCMFRPDETLRTLKAGRTFLKYLLKGSQV